MTIMCFYSYLAHIRDEDQRRNRALQLIRAEERLLGDREERERLLFVSIARGNRVMVELQAEPDSRVLSATVVLDLEHYNLRVCRAELLEAYYEAKDRAAATEMPKEL